MTTSCPECGSYEIAVTVPPDEDGLAEHRCAQCGQYFVEVAEEDEEQDEIDRLRQELAVLRREVRTLQVRFEANGNNMGKAIQVMERQTELQRMGAELTAKLSIGLGVLVAMLEDGGYIDEQAELDFVRKSRGEG